MVSIATKKPCDQKASWGGKDLLSVYLHIAIHYQRKSGQELKQDRNLEAGADAEAMEGAAYRLASYYLPSLLFFSFSFFFHFSKQGFFSV